ncbi:MAG: LapA family protein [Betaproteobacteria bacterium]|nr:LapA family protein [Betaproteobacteria bacterium]
MQLLIITGMLIAACGVIFALQNNVSVTVTFLFWNFESSLALVILLAIAAGGFIIALVSTPSTLRKQWALGRQRKRITELEQICDEMKARIQILQPQVLSVESETTEATSYVGLKQIIAGQDSKSDV